MKKKMIYMAIMFASIMMTGCGSGGGGSVASGALNGAPNQLGATPGGVQDMNFARGLVDSGKVPPPEAFIVEAMYSEHDLPVTGPACDMTLCVRGAMGIAPDAAGVSSGWVQVGLSSNINAETFERPPITIIAAVDTSGSMGWSYQDSTSGIATAKQMLSSITAKLDAADQFGLVSYGSDVSIPLSITAGNSPVISSVISNLTPNGGTNMEAGLKQAFALAEQAREMSDNVRILLFTDEQPNIGATSASEFEQIVSSGADKGIGLTVFGIGLGLRSELTQAMSYMPGGNAFSIMDASEVESFMTDNWPWMVSPIAYDLSVSADIPAGLRITETYGFPNSGTSSEVGFDVATVFLSKNKGALLLKLQGESLQSLAVNLGVTYTGLDGSNRESTMTVSYEGQALDGGGQYMPQAGIAKTVALTLLVTEMKRATSLYQTDPEQAIAILSTALSRFSAYSVLIGDEEITREAAFWPRLLDLMEAGAEQGTFYGNP